MGQKERDRVSERDWGEGTGGRGQLGPRATGRRNQKNIQDRD